MKILQLLFITAIAAPLAARATEPTAADKAAEQESATECAVALQGNPLKNKETLKPTRQPNSADPAKISDADVDALEFTECQKVRATQGEGKKSCDKTLGTVFQLYESEKQSLGRAALEVTEPLTQKAVACSTGQKETHSCIAALYTEVAGKFQVLAERYGKHQVDLETYAKAQKGSADRAISLVTDSASRDQSAQAQIRGPEFISIAEKGLIEMLRGTANQNKCQTSVGASVPPFCGFVTSSAEAQFFANLFKSAQALASKTALCYKAKASSAQALAAGFRTAVGSGDTKDGSSISGKTGMGLEDLMKLATLGMTGGSLYCSVTKSCSPSTASNPSLDTSTSTNGATSPTPDSSNNKGPETSSIGDSKTAGGSTSPISSTNTALETGASTNQYSSAGSSGSADLSPQHFSGSLESRAPASLPATSGGSSFAGIGGSSGSSAPLTAVATPDAGKMLDASGSGTSGFSLGDAHSSSPADATLKSILNGDQPPSPDTALALPGGFGAAGSTQAAMSGPEDATSLFARVKDTHVRCLKRGCVGSGLGDTI
jgi:hypothetical protein